MPYAYTCGIYGRRAPHGARGLKLILLGDCPRPVTSRPAWGAWIETLVFDLRDHREWSRPAWGAWIETIRRIRSRRVSRSRPAWGAWIETLETATVVKTAKSRPAWGAWIETGLNSHSFRHTHVAPHSGRVD